MLEIQGIWKHWFDQYAFQAMNSNNVTENIAEVINNGKK